MQSPLQDVNLSSTPGSAEELPEGTTTSAVLQALEALCAHEKFAGARRQIDFLRFVVHAVLRGDGDDLKEYTIGVGALGRRPDFDPKSDSSVRSEATRIRAKLDSIYDAEPDAYPIRIRLPKGSYRPTFEVVRLAAPIAAVPIDEPLLEIPPADAPEPDVRPSVIAHLASPARSSRSRIAIAGVAGLVALLGAAALGMRAGGDPRPATVQVSRFDAINTDRAFPMISPDGRQAVYAQVQGSGTAPFLFVTSAQGTPIPLNQQGEHAAWSPDGGRLVFRSRRNGGGLFLLDTATQQVRQVTSAGFHPAWSPDGSRIVYSSERFVRPDQRARTTSVLSILDVATGATHELAMPPPFLDAIQPSWSPDGQWLAFWSVHSAGQRDVFVVPAAGGAPQRISEVEPIDWNPVWSPDGWLYWASDKGGTSNLWRVRIGADGKPATAAEAVVLPAASAGFFSFDRAGTLLYANTQPRSTVFSTVIAADGSSASEPIRVTPETMRVRDPSPSPDGETIVGYTTDPQEDLVIIRRDGTLVRRLTHDAFRDRSPEWSPDGRRIAFLSNRSGDYQLWSIQPDGSGLTPLTNHPNGAFGPVWSRDGQRLVWFERGYGLLVTNLAAVPPTHERVPASTAEGIFTAMEWTAGDRGLLGVVRPRAEGAERQIAVYSFEDRALRRLGVVGQAAQWLVDDRLLLFDRDDGIFSYDVTTRTERKLLTLPGTVALARRTNWSASSTTRFVMVQDARVELWTARLR